MPGKYPYGLLMSEKSSEHQLADKARTALLEGIARAAEAGDGTKAKGLAEAYATLVVLPPLGEEGGAGFQVGQYTMSTRRPSTR